MNKQASQPAYIYYVVALQFGGYLLKLLAPDVSPTDFFISQSAKIRDWLRPAGLFSAYCSLVYT